MSNTYYYVFETNITSFSNIVSLNKYQITTDCPAIYYSKYKVVRTPTLSDHLEQSSVMESGERETCEQGTNRPRPTIFHANRLGRTEKTAVGGII